MAFSLQAEFGRLGAAHMQVVTRKHDRLICHFVAECGCKIVLRLESSPHLISVSEALDDKWRQSIITEQMGLETHCHTVEVWTAHSQVLASWTSSHLFLHLLTIALWQPASS